MSNNTSFFVLLAFFFLPILASSQDIKIVYDAEDGSMAYFRNGERITKPAIKKGGQIVFEIKNYNNYLYDVEFQESHETFEVAQGAGLFEGIQGLGIEQLIAPNLIPDNFDPVVSASISITEQEAPKSQMTVEELTIMKLETQISAEMKALESIESTMERRRSEVQNLKDQRELRAISLQEVQKIKYHAKIPPTRIKAYSESYFEKVLDVRDIKEVSLTYLLEKKSDKEELREMLDGTQKSTGAYQKGINSLDFFAGELKTLQSGNNKFFQASQKLEEAPEVLGGFDNLRQSINDLLLEATNDNIQDLINIYYEYEEISANTFSANFRAQGAGDLVNLDVKLLLKDSLKHTGAAPLIQLSTIKVPVYGGVKINASVGVNFGTFLQQPQTYFLKDSIIRGQDTDEFLPYVTSFIHFYRQGRKSISLGGSLGIGIPISSTSSLQSPTFFVGPSLFFGNGERLVLNFGLMGGKVPQLSQGYQVGDVFEADASFIPINSLYEIGVFAGLSFNIGR